MKAYFECGKCGKHSKVEFEGTIKCPHCKSTHGKRCVVKHGAPPDWFNESKGGK
ncbi:hypothetical protein KMC53_gp57 [Klebsiella phage LASTA]|uniref:Uncharacterized protein n=2 Tax=Lastavirus lasta TaxID=2845090 RepID=A0A6H0X3F8_9CAUD|nr:hypothetical protein KMC53_gp57 [Klebsiella phage LASTA]QIW86684.1 hypothetical protein 24149LASTA_00057 [Klebsiella phage LASTA]QIW86760.1 hypothetical protein 24147SJM3_00057 [Klebsiella phage SJM3]